MRFFSPPCPLNASTPRPLCAAGRSFAAAASNRLFASVKFRGTDMPLMCMYPRLNCASSSP